MSRTFSSKGLLKTPSIYMYMYTYPYQLTDRTTMPDHTLGVLSIG